MFKGKVNAEGTVQRLGVLTVLAHNQLEVEPLSPEFRAKVEREIAMTFRGCRGATPNRIAAAHVDLYVAAVQN